MASNNNAKILNIGYGNFVMANRIVAIVSPDSAPVKRLVQESKDRSYCIDATCGRRTRAVIITDSDHVILSSMHPETLSGRYANEDAKNNIDEEADDE